MRLIYLLALGALPIWAQDCESPRGGFPSLGQSGIFQDLQCIQKQSFISNPEKACDESKEQIISYAKNCLALDGSGAGRSNIFLAVRRAYYLNLFDREAMLLFRLTPPEHYPHLWQQFYQRWNHRKSQYPEIFAFDNSPFVADEARGALNERVQQIKKVIEYSQESKKDIQPKLPTSFYFITASIMGKIMQTDFAKKTALRETGGKEADATNALNSEIDSLYMLYPEFEVNPQLLISGDLALVRYKLSLEKLAEDLLKPGQDGLVNSLEERYENLNQLLSEKISKDPDFQNVLQVTDKRFQSAYQALMGILQKEESELSHNLTPLYNDPFLVAQSVLSLNDKTAYYAKQELLAQDCLKIYSDSRWANARNILNTYGGYIGNASLVGLGLGSAMVFGAKKLGGVLLTRVSVNAYRFISPALTNTAIGGAKLLQIAGSSKVAYALAPGAAASLFHAINSYDDKSRAFYRSMRTNPAGTYSELQSSKSNIKSSTVGVLSSMAPLFFLGK